jgi:hypothetical protein
MDDQAMLWMMEKRRNNFVGNLSPRAGNLCLISERFYCPATVLFERLTLLFRIFITFDLSLGMNGKRKQRQAVLALRVHDLRTFVSNSEHTQIPHYDLNLFEQ